MNLYSHQTGEEYQSIFENALEGIFQSTLEGRFIKVNPALARIFGYDSPDDMMQSVVDTSAQLHVDDGKREKFADILSKQRSVEGFEARNYRKDGRIIWTRTNARAVCDDKDNILYFEGFLTDITSLKEAELALRASEERYRALVDRLPGAVYLDAYYDSEKTIYISPRIEDILGYSPEEWLDEIDWSEIIHPEDRERVLAENKQTDETGQAFFQEYRILNKAGEYIWIRDEASLIKNEQGDPLFWQGFFVDISNHKQAESVIAQSEKQFKTIFQANPIASCIATLKDGRYIAANDAYWKLTGFKPDDFLGYTSRELGFLDDQKRKKFIARLTNEKSFQSEDGKLITKSGEIRQTLEFFDLIVFDGQDCILGMFFDITDKVNAQQAILDNKEKYRQLFEAESDAIFLIDNESGNILEANNAAAILYGYSKKELLRKKNSDLSAEPENTQKVTKNTPVNKNLVISIPLRFHKKKDGTIFPVEITGRFFEWGGRSVHIAAIRDITERKNAEEALKTSEERFRLVFQTSPDSISINRLEDGLYIDVNDGFTAVIGYTREEVNGKSPQEINIWEYPEERKKLIDELATNGIVNNQEATFRTKDGRVITGLMSATIITLDGALHTISIIREIETIKQHEAKLQQQLNELTVLHNIAVAASSSKSADELLHRTTDIIGNAFNPDNCGVGLLTESGDKYLAHSSYRGASKNLIKQVQPVTNGISGKVITSGETVRIGDVSQDKTYVEVSKGIQSELCVPIIIQGRVIGTFNIESRQTNAFTESDERLFNTIAGTLATAIEQLRLFETSQRHLQELTILNAVSLACTRALNLDELIENVTQIIGESLYPDNFGMLMLNKEGTSLTPHHSYRGVSNLKDRKYLSLNQGICGMVAATGKPIRIANVRNHKKYIEVTPQVRSELCVPIILLNRVLGVINAESVKINAFSEDDEQLLTTIASTLAIAIEKLRLFDAEKKQRQEAETLREATTALASSLDVQPLLETILDSLAKVVHYDSASIILEHKDGMEIFAARNLPDDFEYVGKLFSKNNKWKHFLDTRSPMIISDAKTNQDFEKWSDTVAIRGWMGVPLVSKNQIIGYLSLDSKTVNTYKEADANLVQTFANQAAIAIENARLFESEQRRHREAETLRQAALAVTTSLDLGNVLETILIVMKQVIPYDSASVLLEENNLLQLAATQGFSNADYLSTLYFQKDDVLYQNIKINKAPIILENARDDKRFHHWGEANDIKGWIGVPLTVHGETIGCITIDSLKAGAFDEHMARVALAFADQAAIAIENARLFREENQRTQIIEAMANIANEFATAQEILPPLEKISQQTLELLDASSVAIYLLQDDNKTIKVVTALGKYREQLLSSTLQLGTGITGQIVANGKPEIVNDMSKDSRRVKVPGTPDDDAKHDTIMSAPLILRGNPIGAINVWRQQSNGQFNQSELNFLVNIANQTSVSIESIRLFQETVRQAQEARALTEVGRDISSTLQLDSVLNRIAQYAKELLKAETSAVYLANSKNKLLQAIAAVGEDAQEIKNDPLMIGKGILGNIALQKSGEIVNDTMKDERAIIVQGTECQNNEHLMGVPVLSNKKLTGLLAVWRTGEGEEFKPFELDFLSSLAQQAAVAIQNAKQFEAEQRHFQEAETLRKAAEALSSTLEIDQVLNSTLESLNHVVPFDSAGVFLIENDNVHLTAVKGIPNTADLTEQLFPGDNALFQEISKTKLPLILEDAQNDTRFEKWIVDQVHSWMGIPLIVRGIIKGYITIDSKRIGIYSEHDANLALTFAHQAAVAIENARLYERGEAQIRQLTVLRDIDSAISSSFDLRVTLNLLIGYAANELNVDAITILLYNSALKSLSPYINIGLENKRNWLQSSYIRVGEGLAGRVVLQRKLIHIDDLNDKKEIIHNPYSSDENFVSYFGIPLISKGQIKGVLELYTRKVFNPDSDWFNFLQTLAGQAAIAIDNLQLFKNLQRSNQELTLAYDTTLAGWGRALELRDKETRGHTDRVVEMTIDLALRLGVQGEELSNIMRGVLLHDIGKVGIPDNILNKPGPLTDEEWEIMRKHPQYAYDLIYPIPYLRPALDIPYAHHERWDGSGYPRGLKGTDIPLAARIFAVVDIWDALLNERVYREAWPEEKVIDYLKNAAGIEIDPNIVENFLEMIQEDGYKYQVK